MKTSTTRAAAAAALLAAAAGCATIRDTFGAKPEGKPSGRDGWLVYTVGALRFEAPATWIPTGTERHVKLAADFGARIEVSTAEQPFADQKACLADAEAVLAPSRVERGRRHPTTFAGLPAVTLEGDKEGWHVWAWAACDGGTQYQVYLTTPSPAAAPAIEAQRTLVASARVGGEA